ncbi:dTMP kinase [Candidatus Poseidoniales archaeon]|jgi:dTMP kinase|nr:dTMP kinase [Candidatus Poseidoniales archaeon]MDB0005247.1 dTMP kinase [Candidatus Poseidoniaceae archaeon]MDA8558057.1 dTMP kinase [Candidatus Poseidoniales archaeon]MDA8615517.1 dTMP kinase [Candidatus Poseidoniales archaeon]MDA8672930.1 dTMP kinase [Candidatus Poseidoniales archaeon]
MYLISVEGGDGSGKGEAARLLLELAAEFPFPEIHATHEPRRHSELGKLALTSVKLGDKTPLEEAGLFAADRLDHSHTWIRPLLQQGHIVISDRNIHSSLIYQGVVGKLGVGQVAKMNAAAMIPDLVLWIDCDPDKAIKRIRTGTLRMTSQKQEYFETPEIQTTIRQGFNDLLSGKISVPAPFDRCCVVGPILNEGGLDDLKKKLRTELRAFFNRKPTPLNVDPDEVDRHLLDTLVRDVKKQTRLPGAPQERTAIHIGWLSGRSPAQWMQEAEDKWPVESARAYDVPATPHAQSCWSVLGTLSLIVGSSEVPRLHRAFGPHRMVTQRHTQRLVKWLEEERWIHKQQSHVPFAEAQVFKLRDERLGYGRLALAMWPLRAQLASWRRANPDAEWSDALPAVALPEDGRTPPPAVRKGLEDITKRLHMLSSGHKNCPVPTSVEELVAWWQLPPP